MPLRSRLTVLSRGTPLLHSLAHWLICGNLLSFAPGVVSLRWVGWDWPWEKMVGRKLLTAASMYHTHPTQRRLGLGNREAGVACYLVAPSQPRCFSVSVLWELRGRRAAAAFKYPREAPRAHSVPGCLGRQPIGIEAVLAARGGRVLAQGPGAG